MLLSEMGADNSGGKGRKRALLVAHHAEHSTAFVALFLSKAGYDVVVATAGEGAADWGDHQVALRFIRLVPGALIVNEGAIAKTDEFGALYLWWRHPRQYADAFLDVVGTLARRCEHKLLFYDAQFGNRWDLWKAQARELRACWRLLLAFEGVAFTTTDVRKGLLDFRMKKKVIPVECGLEFVFKEHLRDELYGDWQPAGRREFFLQAGGGLSVDTGRAEIAKTLSQFFSERGVTLTSDMHSEEKPKRVLWCWNEATIPFDKYPTALRNSDFSLCLNGYTWTSRVAEAVVCGSVPILDTKFLKHYGLPLEDGVNCLIVKGDHPRHTWREAVERAMSIPEEKLAEMRGNLRELRSKWLARSSYADRYLRLLELDVSGVQS